MPELKLGLNDRFGSEGGEAGGEAVASTSGCDGPRCAAACAHPPARATSKSIALDDVTFHQCVDLTKFSSDRVVTFVPPDGEFELMKYRVTDDITLPFKVMPLIREVGRSRIEITVKLRACYAPSIAATTVVVRIPVPGHTARAAVNVSGGKAKYKAEFSAIVWKVKRLPGHDELHLSADVELVRRGAARGARRGSPARRRARWRTRKFGVARPSPCPSRCPCSPPAA